ncbi:MAG: FAD-dependent oxidoreductase, partial [Bdellovibrionales bacterium]|nr:FAD-dependent oxidoreductase [Bdellovibrionales bacterium]
MEKLDCLVIGAGLSGLACARTLEAGGKKVRVIESQDQVGGRVRTRSLGDGFFGDEGFQVLLSSYPELTHFLNLDQLNLKKFNSGAMVYQGEDFDLLANPLVHPGSLFAGLKYPGLSVRDKFLVLKLVAVSQAYASDSPMGVKTTRQFLADFGFSQKFIESFWEPFLSGIYL